MPKVIAFAGTVSFTGTSHGSDEVLYERNETVYAPTLGALFDALLDATERIQETFVDSSSLFDADSGVHWYASYTLPDLLRDVEVGEDADYGFGSAVHDGAELVRSLESWLSVHLSSVVRDLNRTAKDFSMEFFDHWYYGYQKGSGKLFDTMLMEADEAGVLKRWRVKDARKRKDMERSRLLRVAARERAERKTAKIQAKAAKKSLQLSK